MVLVQFPMQISPAPWGVTVCSSGKTAPMPPEVVEQWEIQPQDDGYPKAGILSRAFPG